MLLIFFCCSTLPFLNILSALNEHYNFEKISISQFYVYEIHPISGKTLTMKIMRYIFIMLIDKRVTFKKGGL